MLNEVLQKIDEANAKDPNLEAVDGQEFPKELLYGQRMSAWLEKLEPQASDLLKIAVRGQHIRRWEVPRKSYPMDREGYLNWRKYLYVYHGEKVGEIMREAGYDRPSIERVQFLLQKKKLKTDPETQALEDVICLVFLENYFNDFSDELDDEEKMIHILKRTWLKMSERGHQLALEIPMSDAGKALIEKALN